MKPTRSTLLLAATAAAALFAAGCASLAIEDRDFGLSKASVFDTITPAPFGFDATTASRMIATLPGSGMPPMISHAVDDSLPITAAKNDCRDCHDKPQNIGKPVATGKARPAPANHYASGSGGALALDSKIYNCIACHAPQADVPALVRNASR